MFYVGLTVILFLAVIFFSPLCFDVALKAREEFAIVRVKIGVFSGKLSVSLRFRLNYNRRDGIELILIKNNGMQKRIKRKRKKGKKLPWMRILKHVKTKQLDAFIGIGVGDDTFLAVILIGIIKILLETAGAVLLQTRVNAAIAPDFTRKKFVLNVNGIFRIRAEQIIIVMVKRLFTRKKRKRGKQYASD